MITSRRPGRMGRWFLLLFALPFAGVGVFMGGLIVRNLADARAMQRWPSVPARLLEVELQENHGDSTTWRAAARYTYTFDGRDYEASRVGLHGGSDNVGDWQRRVYHELLAHRQAGTPVPVRVNPAQPGDAILYPGARFEMLWFQGIFAVCFGLVGLGLLGYALFGLRSVRRAAAANPEEPWTWREDWATGVIRCGNRARMAVAIIFAIFWNALSWGIAVLAYGDVMRQKGPALLVFLFPAIGIGLAAWAVREVLVARRYGSSFFRMASVPGVLGGRLAGVVQLPDDARGLESVRVRLQCVEQVRRGKNTSEAIRWEDALDLMPDRLPAGDTGLAIPVLFAPPYDALPSAAPGGSDVTWRLSVRGRQPGIDVDVVFDVPVFATKDSRPDFELDRSPMKAFLVPEGDVSRLEVEGVHAETLGDRHAYDFPAAARKGQAVVVTLAAAAFGAAAVFLWPSDAPRIMAAIFSLFALLLVWAAVDAWTGSAHVEADRTALRWSSRRLLWTRSQELPAGEVADIVSERWGEANGQGMYRLRAVASDGRRHTLGRTLYDPSAASTLAAALKRALGLPVT